MRVFTFSIIKQRFNTFNSFSDELIVLTNNLFLVLISFAKYLQSSCSLFILTIAINKDLLEIAELLLIFYLGFTSSCY